MSIITSSGDSIKLDIRDPDIANHVEDPKSYAKIIMRQINTERIYDRFLKDRRDMTILDIGANVGLFTLYAKDSASRIVSVEPTPSHQNLFEKICGKYDNVELVKAALSGKDGDIEFFLCDNNSTCNSLIKTPDRNTNFTVKGLTLDSILKTCNLEHVDFCKIDIEGSEMVAITEDTLKPVYDKIDRMFIEVHATQDGPDLPWQKSLNINRKKIEEVLKNVGYNYENLPSLYEDTISLDNDVIHVFKDSGSN
jgi:FkbM family methyltransferase